MSEHVWIRIHHVNLHFILPFPVARSNDRRTDSLMAGEACQAVSRTFFPFLDPVPGLKNTSEVVKQALKEEVKIE